MNIGTFTDIGATLGYPATLVVFYLWITVRRLDKDNEVLKKTLSDIRSDTSYIKGKLDGKQDKAD